MKSKTSYFLLILLSLSLSRGSAQNIRDNAEKYFYTVDGYGQFNGNMVLGQDGNEIWQHPAGYADRSLSRKNANDSQFNLASVSKIFTATAVLQLRDRKKFSLDEPVSKFLPLLPFKAVSIRHLLTHTSGLPDLELYEALIRQYPDTIITNANVLPELKKWRKGLYFKPGDEFRYCNTEYSLLALLVERVSHMPFQAYLRKYIFLPAGMKHTYVSLPEQRNLRAGGQAVRLYERARRFTDSVYVNVDSLARNKYTNYNCSGTIGESGVISTTGDMLRFDHAFFSGRLLRQVSIDEALTPVSLNNGKIHEGPMDTMHGEGKGYYGLGWEIIEQPMLGRSVGHGGFKFGLATYYLHHLADKKVVVAFDNSPGPAFGQLVTAAYALLNNKTVLPFSFKRSLAMLYGNTLVKEGPEMAISKLNLMKADTAHYYLSEWEMDKVGGDLFFGSDFKGHQELGVEAFKLNTLLFPAGYNTYDSYGEVLRLTGKKQAAVLEYRKSLELNPKSEGGQRALKELADEK